jgi:hypothetical protein
MRRRLLVSLTGVLAASTLVVGMSAGAASAEVPSAKKAAACAGKTKKAAIKQIKSAYLHFLDGAKYPDPTTDKEPYIEQLSGSNVNAELKAQFEASAATNAEASKTTTVDVDKVTCTGKKTADVNYTLVIGGTRAEGLAPPGDALIEDGVWKVSALTLCNTQALGDPTVLEKAPCADIAAGL